MLQVGHRQLLTLQPALSTALLRRREEIDDLHKRCGVYTRPDVVKQILDAVGWIDSELLSDFRLLEPAAGDGAFVTEAARRLLAACRKHGVQPKAEFLRPCIKAYEIHPREVRKARRHLQAALHELGVHHSTSKALASAWIVNSDFLLAECSTEFTHVVGNPPYVRWSKVPSSLRAEYSKKLPRKMIGGDLFLPFLDRALQQLQPGGSCGFLCSDRWRFMAFAAHFRAKWMPQLHICSEQRLLASKAYVGDVDTYPTILIAKRKIDDTSIPAILHRKTLTDYGFRIRVGPALGVTEAYVLSGIDEQIEPEILLPWLDTSEIGDGRVAWTGRQVIVTHTDDGKLRGLKLFPNAMRRLRRFRLQLSERSIVKKGAPWFRPIDRIRGCDWRSPKLLIPEIAKVPRVALDCSGAVPSHGIYAIFAPHGNIDTLYDHLSAGGLAKALDGIAPKIKGGYVRCYKRFLEQIVLT